jgi:hypothetical protein
MAKNILEWQDLGQVANILAEEGGVNTLSEIALEGDQSCMRVLDLALNATSNRFYGIAQDHPGDTDAVVEMMIAAIMTRGSGKNPETEIVLELVGTLTKFLGFPKVQKQVSDGALHELNSKVGNLRDRLLEDEPQDQLVAGLDGLLSLSEKLENEPEQAVEPQTAHVPDEDFYPLDKRASDY